jgi:3',5'-cyclic AMP phosphodiesterase CpdA
MKIAHISDLHITSPSFNPLQIFSKEIIGNMNYFLNRRKSFDPKFIYDWLDFVESLNIDLVIVSGDFSTTSSSKELELARTWIQAVKKRGIDLFAIPGNHDSYTSHSYRNKSFYTFLGSVLDFRGDENIPFSLDEHGLIVKKINKDLWIIGLDTTCTPSLLLSQGKFSLPLEDALQKALSYIPKEAKVIVVNHFSLFAQENSAKDLLQKERLTDLLKLHPQIAFYLHGHTHRHCVVDLRHENLPIILDAGCISQKERSTWNLIEMNENNAHVDVYLGNKAPSWDILKSYNFAWS